MGNQRGDSIIEVLLAITVFALISMGAITIMSQGTNASQRAIEVNMVRHQIDAQAEALRAAQEAQAKSGVDLAWREITSGVNTTKYNDTTKCPTSPSSVPGSFVMDARDATKVSNVNWLKPADQNASVPYPEVVYSPAPVQSYGIWIERARKAPADVSGVAAPDAYDFTVRACWFGPGLETPLQIETNVRLYSPEKGPLAALPSPAASPAPSPSPAASFASIVPASPSSTPSCSSFNKAYSDSDVQLIFPKPMTYTQPNVKLSAGCRYQVALTYGDKGHITQRAACAKKPGGGDCAMLYESIQEQFAIEFQDVNGAVRARLPATGFFADIGPTPDQDVIIANMLLTIPAGGNDVSKIVYRHINVSPVDRRDYVAGNSVHVYGINLNPI